jgi:SOS response associated peptidase (SRAP)
MCGRVRLSSDYSEIKITLKFDLDAPAPNFEREWNLPPTRPMLVAIRSVDGKRTPKMMRWGLLPHWAKDEKIAYSTFNARSEEFTTRPAFRDAWKRGQRCLVVTDGFYEWKKLAADGRSSGRGSKARHRSRATRHPGTNPDVRPSATLLGQELRVGLEPVADDAGTLLAFRWPVSGEAVVRHLVGFDAECIPNDLGGAVAVS